MVLNAGLMFTMGQPVGSVMCARLDITDDSEMHGNLSLFLSADEPSVTIVTVMSATVVIKPTEDDNVI